MAGSLGNLDDQGNGDSSGLEAQADDWASSGFDAVASLGFDAADSLNLEVVEDSRDLLDSIDSLGDCWAIDLVAADEAAG